MSKFYTLSLGCKVNSYEIEAIKDSLLNCGHVHVEKPEDADYIIINTCCVTNTGAAKSRQKINQMNRINPHAKLIVMGCYVQGYEDEVKQLPGISFLVGTANRNKIIDYVNGKIDKISIVEDTKNNIEYEELNISSYFENTRAYLKIQDGCNNYCTYCIIPYVRGTIKSRKKEDVINEAKRLISLGYKEIVLTGIHTGSYGKDLDNYSFSDLVSDLLELDGLYRLRISSIEITEINDRVIDIIRDNDVLVDHMHIPLQSGSDFILKSMNRKYDMKYFFDKISILRSIRPDMSITTDVIVGFPGETDQLFLETVDNIKKIGFTKLHVFPYSRRSGTRADSMDCQVDECVKKKRVRVLLDLSKELEISYMNKFIGRTVSFIPEVLKDGYLIGHTGNYLLIKYKSDNLLHDSINVTITDIEYPYCIGE